MGSSRSLLPSYLNKQAKWKNKLCFFTSGTKLPLLLKVHMLPQLCLIVWIRCLPSSCKVTCAATLRGNPDCFNSPRTSLLSPQIGSDIRWSPTQPSIYLLVGKQQGLMTVMQPENISKWILLHSPYIQSYHTYWCAWALLNVTHF